MDQEAEWREVKRVEDLEAAALKPFTDADAEATANAAVEATPYFRRRGEPEPSEIETVDQAHAKDGVEDGDFLEDPSTRAHREIAGWMLLEGYLIGDASTVPELLQALVAQAQADHGLMAKPKDTAQRTANTDIRTSQREERRQKRLAEKGY